MAPLLCYAATNGLHWEKFYIDGGPFNGKLA